MNALKTTLEIGDELILTDGRKVKVSDQTFGCFSFTSGTAVGVEYNGQKFRIDGVFDINVEATKRLKNG